MNQEIKLYIIIFANYEKKPIYTVIGQNSQIRVSEISNKVSPRKIEIFITYRTTKGIT